MFYVHTGRYGPRPPPPGGLNGPRLPPFPDRIGGFTRFATFSAHSSSTMTFNSSYPMRREEQKEEEPYVSSPVSTPAESVAGRPDSPSSVFRIESIASSSEPPTPGILSPVDDLLDQGEETPRAATPEAERVSREYDQYGEVDDLISELDVSARLAKEYDKLETVDDLLRPSKFSSSLELSDGSRQKHEYLSRAPPPEQLIGLSDRSAFSTFPTASSDTFYSAYATPYTSCHTVYYSAEENLHLIPGASTPVREMDDKKDITTSRVITETISMVTTGIITPPLGQRSSPTDTITLTDVFGHAEDQANRSGSEDEELQQFSRSETVRRSILPGQRKRPSVVANEEGGETRRRSPTVISIEGTSEEKEYPVVRVITPPRNGSPREFPKVRVDTPPRPIDESPSTLEGVVQVEAEDVITRIHDYDNPPSDSETFFSFSTEASQYHTYPNEPRASHYDVPPSEASEATIASPIPSESHEGVQSYQYDVPPLSESPEEETATPPPTPLEVPKEVTVPILEDKKKEARKQHYFSPSSSYLLEETTTERIEETTEETVSETRDYSRHYRSPLFDRYSGPIITRREPHGGRVLKMVTEMGSATIGGISPALSANAAKSFLEATDKEKKELQGLNDRLGNYIDRVKRLEEQNRKLVADLDELRGKWGKDTSEIKIKFSESLSTARKDIDDSARRKAEIDVKAARLRDDLAEYRSRYEDVQHRRESDREKISQWTNAIADAQSELDMLRARWKQLTEEEKRLNSDNARLWDELQKARNDLDEETVGRIDFQNQVQTLMEELEFLRRIHEQEVKELQALLAQAPADTREFFKNELALAIRDIKDEYDYIAKQGKQDMESWYKLKVSEVQGSANRAAMESNYQREEVKRMRDNIGDLRGKLGDLENKNALLEKEVQNLNYQLNDDQRQYELALNDRDSTLRRMREECQTLVAELQGLLDTKQMLDAEIAIYRKMLEGEESRVGLRQMVEQVVKTHSLQQQEDTDSTRSVRGEVSTKTTFQRSAKGNVTIAECDPNGKFITLENTHRTKDEPLGEYKLKRKLDGNRREIVYTIPAGVVLNHGKTMKIYARDQGGIHNPPDSLVFEGENTWGIGANVVTSLINKEGDERATHTQKTIQTGQ